MSAAVLYTLGALTLLLGLAGLVLPALPGAPLLVAGAFLVAWAEGFTRVGWPTIALSAVLAGAIVAVDFLASALGAKAFGASRWAVIGATVGLLAGLFLGLPGILLGPGVGAIVFEWLRNPDFARALRAGVGATIGFIVGGAVKVALGFVLVGAIVLALLV
jgi:uncharacterized protein YqgC (DUF456 family)